MHPIKERILEYEKKYGYNLQARRAFNQAIMGGVNPFSWFGTKLKSWFGKKDKQTSYTKSDLFKTPKPVSTPAYRSTFGESKPISNNPSIVSKSSKPYRSTFGESKTISNNPSIVSKSSKPYRSTFGESKSISKKPSNASDSSQPSQYIPKNKFKTTYGNASEHNKYKMSKPSTTTINNPFENLHFTSNDIFDLTTKQQKYPLQNNKPSDGFVDLTSSTKTQSNFNKRKITNTFQNPHRKQNRFDETNEWRVAYCKLAELLAGSYREPTIQQQMQMFENLEKVDFIFEEHEHGGEGDCFLYAWIGSSEEQNDDRVSSLIQTCDFNTSSNTLEQIKALQQRLQQARTTKNLKYVDFLKQEIMRHKMMCLRQVLGDHMKEQLHSRKLEPLNKQNLKNTIDRIYKQGTWIQDEDIQKIADYLNFQFYVYIQNEQMWRMFTPTKVDPNIKVSTFYLVLIGSQYDNFVGSHFRSLTKKYKGNFNCS